jgi:hypothetical protein
MKQVTPEAKRRRPPAIVVLSGSRPRNTKRTHQKRHARRLATHLHRLQQFDLQDKLCRE